MDTRQSPARRYFLGALLSGMGFVAAAVLLVPGGSYLLDPWLRKRKDNKSWRKVASSQLVGKEPVAVSVRGQRVDAWTKYPERRLGTVWIRRKEDGQLAALSAECPHLGCQINYDRSSKHFVCPCHDSAFDMQGTPLKGPSPRAMDPLEVRESDGRVEVRFIRYRLQTSERVELG